MRPRGEMRQRLREAAFDLTANADRTNWRAMAVHARVGFAQAKGKVRDMIRAGELACVGEMPVANSRRPMLALTPVERLQTSSNDAANDASADAGGLRLQAALRGWRAP